MQAEDPRTPWMDDAEELGHVIGARKGDRAAFLALARHYHRPVYRLAFALTRDVRTAAAVTHAALLKAKEGVRYIADGRRFFPWVAGIVRNLARARHRPGDFEDPPSGSPGANPGVVELAKRLLLTMDRLDPDEQAAVALRIAESLPDSLIEAVLRVTPGSVPSLLAGARSRLAAVVAAGEPQRAGHLAPDQLSAHIDGTLEGGSLDFVRHHLKTCETCRAQGLRMASANDVLSALLTHDPDDRFLEALQGLLEEQFEANDPADSIPPGLEPLLATERARLDARRWAAVREAIPGAPVMPASAVRPLGVAPPPEPAVPAGTADAAAPRPAGGVIPAAVPRSAPPPGPTPIPAMAVSPAARPTGPSLPRGGASRVIGAAVVAVALLMAGLYLARGGSRTRVGDSLVASESAGTVSAPVQPVADSRVGTKSADLPEPKAGGSATTSDTGAAAAKATGAPEALVAPPAPDTTRRGVPGRKPAVAPATTPAVAPATAPAAAPATAPSAVRATAPAVTPAATPTVAPTATQRRTTAARPPAAPAHVAGEWGILCGQVRDERGLPIVRAQVLLADLHVGALTDPHGRFCISAPLGSRTLSVIALGFTTQRRVVTVGSKTPEVAVTLRSAAVEESPGDGSP